MLSPPGIRATVISLTVLSLAAAASAIPLPDPALAEGDNAASAILAVMKAAEAGWNEGDIPAYMGCYWQSDALQFFSGDRRSRGWDRVLDGYQDRYPDRDAMGTLSFTEMEVWLLAADAAIVTGRWALQRQDDRPHGLFTLVFRLLPEGWRIVHDHTSSG